MTMLYETTFATGRQRSADAALAERHARVIRLMTGALSESRRLGHNPSRAIPESEGFGSVSYCTGCGMYVCVDLDESREPYGSAYTQPCTRNRKGKRL